MWLGWRDQIITVVGKIEEVPTIYICGWGVEGLHNYNVWKGANRRPQSWLWLGWRA
jgi:hypothetical protein